MAANNLIKVGITGCAGRMGSLLVRELQAGADGLALAAGSEKAPPPDAKFFVTASAPELFNRSDVIIDFTVPVATFVHARLAGEHKKPIVIGTTGLGPAEEKEIKAAAAKVPIVYAANMSVGVNLLLALVEKAAARLGPDLFDIEVTETHHKHKKDAPSGTALALGKAAAQGRGITLDPHPPADRNGGRKPGTIGFSVQRGGDVVGEHTVSFFGAGERVSLTHIASDRALFARGALQAARWVVSQPPGLYTMRDVLGL
jgi:4-hydroxy-tetrahydrodipicolinate reductase